MSFTLNHLAHVRTESTNHCWKKWTVGSWMMAFTISTINAFSRILKPPSFCKFTVEVLPEKMYELQVCNPFFFFMDVLLWKNHVFYFPLFVLLLRKLAQGLLVIFCSMFCIFLFLVSNKIEDLVHVFFVYFVTFVVCFIFVFKVLYLRTNTWYKSLSLHVLDICNQLSDNVWSINFQ